MGFAVMSLRGRGAGGFGVLAPGLIFCFEVLLAAGLRLPPGQTYYGLLTPSIRISEL